MGGMRWKGWAGTVTWGTTGACISCCQGSYWRLSLRGRRDQVHALERSLWLPCRRGPVRQEQMPGSPLEAFLLPGVEAVAVGPAVCTGGGKGCISHMLGG